MPPLRAVGQSWGKIWAPALQTVEVLAGPSPGHGLLVSMEASVIEGMSDPLLLHKELRNVLYLEIKVLSTDQF